MTSTLQTTAKMAPDSPRAREEIARRLRRDGRVALWIDAVLVAIATTVAFAVGDGHAALSALVGGAIGGLNLLALAWLTARLVHSMHGGALPGRLMALFFLKFLGLIGVIAAVVLILEPDVTPFLVGFSLALPVIVGVSITRFRAS